MAKNPIVDFARAVAEATTLEGHPAINP